MLGAAVAANADPPLFAPSPLRHVRANGISIGYRSIGSGPPLVMIRGYSGTLYIWGRSRSQSGAARGDGVRAAAANRSKYGEVGLR